MYDIRLLIRFIIGLPQSEGVIKEKGDIYYNKDFKLLQTKIYKSEH